MAASCTRLFLLGPFLVSRTRSAPQLYRTKRFTTASLPPTAQVLDELMDVVMSPSIVDGAPTPPSSPAAPARNSASLQPWRRHLVAVLFRGTARPTAGGPGEAAGERFCHVCMRKLYVLCSQGTHGEAGSSSLNVRRARECLLTVCDAADACCRRVIVVTPLKCLGQSCLARPGPLTDSALLRFSRWPPRRCRRCSPALRTLRSDTLGRIQRRMRAGADGSPQSLGRDSLPFAAVYVPAHLCTYCSCPSFEMRNSNEY